MGDSQFAIGHLVRNAKLISYEVRAQGGELVDVDGHVPDSISLIYHHRLQLSLSMLLVLQQCGWFPTELR